MSSNIFELLKVVLKGFGRLQLLFKISIRNKLTRIVEYCRGFWSICCGSETASKVVLLLQLAIHRVSDFVPCAKD